MANTTWSTTDHSASITLSGGNLIASSTATGQGGRAADKQISGKFYWEITANTFVNGSSGIGIVNSVAVLTTMGSTPSNASFVYPSGTIWNAGASTGLSIGAITAGSIVCIALDQVNKRLWYRKGAAGNWNGSPSNDPATNVGGIDASKIVGGTVAAYPAYSLAAASEQIIANFGDSGFTGTVPSGFSAGFTTSTITTNDTIWNSSDLVNAAVTGNSLSANGAGASQGGIRTVKSYPAGKYYFEATITASAASQIGVGIANSSANLSTAFSPPVNASYVFNDANSSVFVNSGTAVGNLGVTQTSGNVVSVAFDLTNKRIWYRLAPSGNWNGSSSNDPASNIGGFDISAIAGSPLFGAAFFAGSASSNRIATANFGDSPFTGTVPSGFTAGLPVVVDFAGNLGGVSSYGKLAYGVRQYSRVAAFAPTFGADFLVSAGITFSGDFAPAVSFGADLGITWGLSGDLAPTISFSAALDVVGFVDFGGDLAPQIDLGGSLSLDLSLTALDGSFGFMVVLEASGFVSGPLWAESEPCPSPPWADSEPCPPSLWTPIGPCDPVEWEKSELCNG